MRRRLATLCAVGALLTGMLATGGLVIAANQSANLDQCANDPLPSSHLDGCNSLATQWVNGNLGASKSVYFEGDSIPYRMTFSNLVTTSTVVHHLVIEWDTTKGGTHALDYLTTWNATVANANPCLGISGTFCTGIIADASHPTIPKDPQVDPGTPSGTGAVGGQPAGQFALWGGSIISVSGYTYSNGTGFTGDKSASIQINFTATVANPVLAWGGHIATRTAWGPLKSAVTIPGSPYHTRLISLDGVGGNQDRSLSADAVIFPASITIIKDAVPNDLQDFSFTDTGGLTPSSFTLDDDAGVTGADNTHSNTQTFTNILTFSTYTFVEGAVSHWTLSFQNPVCTVTSANGGSQSASVSTRTLTIGLKEGENVTCTFVNTHVTNGPTIGTTLSATTGNIGDTVHDSSTLTGATSDAAGTVKYAVYSDLTACNAGTYTTPGGTSAGSKTVVAGVVPDSNGILFSNAGTYYWRAFYSGDPNNTATSSACLDEVLVISPNTTGLTTETNETTGGIGDTLTDSATLTGATASAGGTIDFFLFAPGATCDSTVPITGYVYSATGVPVTTNGTYSSADGTPSGDNTATAAGTYTWVAVYTDGDNNVSSHSACGDEDVVISPNTPGLTTDTNPDSGNIGDTLTDSATLTGATAGAGTTIDFYLFAPGVTCATDGTGAVYSSTGVPVSGNGTYQSSAGTESGSNAATAAGTYTWVAVYTGDANNTGTNTDCGDEDVVISPNTPAISTTPNLLPNDSIDLSGLTADATGSLYVELQIDAPCGTASPAYSKTWDDGLTGNDLFTGNGTYDTDNTAVFVTASHKIQWCTSYSGDANNAPRALATDGETIDITFNAPEIVAGAAFGFAIPMLVWGLWNRKRRQAGE